MNILDDDMMAALIQGGLRAETATRVPRILKDLFQFEVRRRAHLGQEKPNQLESQSPNRLDFVGFTREGLMNKLMLHKLCDHKIERLMWALEKLLRDHLEVEEKVYVQGIGIFTKRPGNLWSLEVHYTAPRPAVISV